ncbi:ABC transporter substrate-binding protein [Argonema antarcticum]|uniref:ABC transporter substrate-binding protein n=1 Tax=Argonema antarcticum TaxID=2942763 RepID=UPI002012E794|nr:extracellular solute-binding protein [Argonema antarcticum]MCL1469431.1 extracellular solute-binding protein [Argonema antarcticum A004/B2]
MTNDLRLSQFDPNRRQFLKTAAAAVSGLALSGCGWTLAQVRPKPPSNRKNGANKKLYIYTWSSYTDEDLLKSFTKETGIEVIVAVYDSNETMLAKIQIGGGADYSIIYPSDYMVRQMRDKNLLLELDRDRLIGLDNLLPQFQNPVYDLDNSYSVPLSWGTTGLIYNSETLKQAPEDWDYLWEQQQVLSRRITMLDDVREVMGATLRMLGYSYNSQDSAQLEQAYQKLASLKSTIASFSTDTWKEQILAGDLLVSMGYSADAVEVAKENPSLQYAIPRSGTSLWTDTMIIPASAPNRDAAYNWINFMLQPAVAAQVCERLNFATPNQVAIKQLPPKVSENPSLFPKESVLEKCERIIPLGKFNQVYDRYWTQLTSS